MKYTAFLATVLIFALLFPVVVNAYGPGNCDDFGKQIDDAAAEMDSGSVVTIDSQELSSYISDQDVSEFGDAVSAEVSDSGFGGLSDSAASGPESLGISSSDLDKALKSVGVLPTLNYSDYEKYCPDPSDLSNIYCDFVETGYIYPMNFSLDDVYARSVKSNESTKFALLSEPAAQKYKFSIPTSSNPEIGALVSSQISGSYTNKVAIAQSPPFVFGVQMPKPMPSCEIELPDDGTVAGATASAYEKLIKLTFASNSGTKTQSAIKYYLAVSSIAPNDTAYKNFVEYKDNSFADASVWGRALLKYSTLRNPTGTELSRLNLIGKFLSWRKSKAVTSEAAIGMVEKNLTDVFSKYSSDVPELMELLRMDFDRAGLLADAFHTTDSAERELLLGLYAEKTAEMTPLLASAQTKAAAKGITLDMVLSRPGITLTKGAEVLTSFFSKVTTQFDAFGRAYQSSAGGAPEEFFIRMSNGNATDISVISSEINRMKTTPGILDSALLNEMAGAEWLRGTKYAKLGLATLASNYANGENLINYLTEIQTKLSASPNNPILNAERNRVMKKLSDNGFKVVELPKISPGAIAELSVTTPKGTTGKLSDILLAVNNEKASIAQLSGLEFKTSWKDAIASRFAKLKTSAKTAATLGLPKLNAKVDSVLIKKSVGLFVAKKVVGTGIKFLFSWPVDLVVSAYALGKSQYCATRPIEYPELIYSSKLEIDTLQQSLPNAVFLKSSASFMMKPEKNLASYKECMSSWYDKIASWFSTGGIITGLRDPLADEKMLAVANKILIYSDNPNVTCQFMSSGGGGPYIQKNIVNGKIVEPFNAEYSNIKCTGVNGSTRLTAFEVFKPTSVFSGFMASNNSRITNKEAIQNQLNQNEYEQIVGKGFLSSAGTAEFSKGTVNLSNTDKLIASEGFVYKTNVIFANGTAVAGEFDSLVISMGGGNFIDTFKVYSGNSSLTESEIANSVKFTDCKNSVFQAGVSVNGNSLTINAPQGKILVGNTYCVDVMIPKKSDASVKGRRFTISNIQAVS